MPEVHLKYGKGKVQVRVPDRNFAGCLEPFDLPGVDDPLKEVDKGLKNPTGSASLRELASGRKSAVVIASDITRPSPSRVLVPPIVQELLRAGIPRERISVVFALGSHRKHTPEEQVSLLGDELLELVECVDHDASLCVGVGTTSRGTPVEVFARVAEADLVVGTGNIEFHYKAGYTGGHKALLPGVCSKKTIEANHLLGFQPGAMPGKIAGNPMREDIEEGGRLGRLCFIVNAVLNSRKQIVRVVAGDPVAAHREGVVYVDRMYKRILPSRADIVLASCGGFPKDINLYQAQKGIENASHAVKDGGHIILLAECSDGIGEPTFEQWMLEAQTPSEPVERLKREFRLGGHKAAALCEVLLKKTVHIFSSMPPAVVSRIFMRPAASVQATLDALLSECGADASVLVMPEANSTLPYVEE